MYPDLKKKIIKLLKEDEEFRYTVAGLIGLQEILKRLDRIEEEQKALREEQKLLREEQKALREEQKALREDFNKMLAMIQNINTRLGRLEITVEDINTRLKRVERTTEKMTVDVEEEARSFVKYKLREKGINIEVDTLRLPEAEINIYGANDEVCVIGDASIRAGLKILDELEEKYELLKRKYPGYLRRRVILVLYVILPLPELVEEARRRKIWLFKATKDYVPLEEVL